MEMDRLTRADIIQSVPVDSQFWLASGYFNLIDRYETAIVDGEVWL